MIGDLLSNLSRANKLGISDIQRAVQDGTLPAYVGVPLLQQKMQQRQQAAALLSGQQSQNQPPIGQQIMDQARQMIHGGAPQQPPMPQAAPQPQEDTPQGIDAAQSNLPAQGYAPGGIVAFSDGGDAEDDSDVESAQYGDPGELSSEEKTLLAQYQSPVAMPTRKDYSYSDEADLGLPGITTNYGKPSVSSAGITAVEPKQSLFQKAMSFIMPHEGGYSANPADKGGPTNYGISKPALEDYLGRKVSDADVKNLSRNTAMQIYKKKYWDAIGADRLDPHAAIVAFDTAVQHGVGYAKNLLDATGGDTNAMIAARGNKYKGIVANDPSQSVFARGWGNRLADLGNFTSSFAGGGIVSLAGGGDIDYGYLFAPEIAQNSSTQQMEKAVAEAQATAGDIDYGDLYAPEIAQISSTQQMKKAVAEAQATAAATPKHDLLPPRSAAGTYPYTPEETTARNAWETGPTDDLQQGYGSLFNMYGNMGQPTTEAPAVAVPAQAEESTYKPTETAGDDYLKKFGDYIDSQKESLKQQKNLSPWLALLGAGAGMMGRSNFAAPNIGAGITAGLGAYGNLRGMEAKQEQGIAGALSTAARAQLMNESRLDRINEMADYHTQMAQNRADQSQIALQLGRERIAATANVEAQKIAQKREEQQQQYEKYMKELETRQGEVGRKVSDDWNNIEEPNVLNELKLPKDRSTWTPDQQKSYYVKKQEYHSSLLPWWPKPVARSSSQL